MVKKPEEYKKPKTEKQPDLEEQREAQWHTAHDFKMAAVTFFNGGPNEKRKDIVYENKEKDSTWNRDSIMWIARFEFDDVISKTKETLKPGEEKDFKLLEKVGSALHALNHIGEYEVIMNDKYRIDKTAPGMTGSLSSVQLWAGGLRDKYNPEWVDKEDRVSKQDVENTYNMKTNMEKLLPNLVEGTQLHTLMSAVHEIAKDSKLYENIDNVKSMLKGQDRPLTQS